MIKRAFFRVERYPGEYSDLWIIDQCKFEFFSEMINLQEGKKYIYKCLLRVFKNNGVFKYETDTGDVGLINVQQNIHKCSWRIITNPGNDIEWYSTFLNTRQTLVRPGF